MRNIIQNGEIQNINWNISWCEFATLLQQTAVLPAVAGQAIPAGDRELQATLKERAEELENINCEQRVPLANTI